MSSWPTKELDMKMAAALELNFAKEHSPHLAFVTISREYGCDGKKLANAVVAKLNEICPNHPWQLFDRDMLLKHADPDIVDEKMLNILDDCGQSDFRSYLAEALFGRPSQYKLMQNIAKVMRMLARRGHIVFLGRGAAILTKDIEAGFHYRLYAPEQWRIENHAKRHGISPDEAVAKVQKYHHDREEFLNTHLSEPISDPGHYHLMLNNAKVDIDHCVDMIFEMTKDQVYCS